MSFFVIPLTYTYIQKQLYAYFHIISITRTLGWVSWETDSEKWFVCRKLIRHSMKEQGKWEGAVGEI